MKVWTKVRLKEYNNFKIIKRYNLIILKRFFNPNGTKSIRSTFSVRETLIIEAKSP